MAIINYNKEFERVVLENSEAKILLHCCCAVCAGFCVERFRELGIGELELFFYNPNIMPKEEYEKRTVEMEKLNKKRFLQDDINLTICEYRHGEFLDSIKGYEYCNEGGEKCKKCFYLRLKETAKMAKELGHDYFATTLTVSPHKNSEIINTIGFEIEKEIGIKYLPSDFKKGGGFLRSLEIAKELSLYRQNYCGCLFF